jgi:hypothetical protein
MPFKVHSPWRSGELFQYSTIRHLEGIHGRDSVDIQGYMMIALPANEATYSA